MSDLKSSRMMSCRLPSNKLYLHERQEKESNICEPVSRAEAYHSAGRDFQEESKSLSSSPVYSQKYYKEYEWESCSTASSKQCESSEPRSLEPYNQAIKASNFNLINSKMKHDDSKLVEAEQKRKSAALNYITFHDAQVQARSYRSENNVNHQKSDFKFSTYKAQPTSYMQISSPDRRPAIDRRTPYVQEEFSFVSTNPQKSYKGSVHIPEHEYPKSSNDDSNTDKSRVYDRRDSRREQIALSTQHVGILKSTAGLIEPQGWCSQNVLDFGSPRLAMNQRWLDKPRLARVKELGSPEEKSSFRSSVVMNTRDHGKFKRGTKSRPSWRNVQLQHCTINGIKVDNVKSRREYAVASQNSIYGKRAPKAKRQRQLSDDKQPRSLVDNEEDCVNFSSKSVSRLKLQPLKATWAEDPIAARLRQRSMKLSNMYDSDTGSSDDDNEDSTSEPYSTDHKISITLPSIYRKEPVNRPLATITNYENPDARCIQLDKLIKIETNKHIGDVFMSDKEKLHAAELKKATQYLITRKVTQQVEIPLTPHFCQTGVYHPCYIGDIVGQVMSFLSLMEIMKAKRVAKVWEIAANSTLRRRTVENLTINPPSTAEAGSMMLSQVHIFLPRLQCLTLNINHFKHLKGLVLSYVCECKNLVFLRVENLEWRDLMVATQVILSLRDPGNQGHPILNILEDLELPDSKLPIPTSTQCIRPLSKLAPNLRSLTVKSAQDPIIFSLRLFFPSVRNLFLLDTLWTTRRFAQIISSSPHLMKFLMDGQKVRMLTPIVTGGSGMHISSPVCSTPSDRMSVPHTPRIHSLGSVPVTPSDDRLTPLISNHKESLYVEPLGRVKQIETGNDLTKANIGMFAGFCALIGVLIIMPPMDGHD
jgi:hypothetical protein